MISVAGRLMATDAVTRRFNNGLNRGGGLLDQVIAVFCAIIGLIGHATFFIH